MTITLSDLSPRVSSLSLSKYGDEIEKGSYSIIKKHIPNYEEFWKNMVLPFRGTDSTKSPILLSDKLYRDHETVSIYNYSLLRTFLRVFENREQLKLEYELKSDVSTDLFNDCIIYMSIGYNQINNLGLSILLTFLIEKPDYEIDIIHLSKLDIDPKKKSEKKRYYRKCKEAYGNTLVENIVKSGNKLNRIRNFIVHGPKFAGYEGRIPKPEKVLKLIQWSDFHKYIENDKDDSNSWLIERNQLVQESTDTFFKLINEFWGVALNKIIEANPEFNQDYINPFFHATDNKSEIPQKYDEHFSSFSLRPPTASGIINRSYDSGSTSGGTISR